MGFMMQLGKQKSPLSDYRIYERQIERLHSKCLHTHQLYELCQDGVSLASVVMNARKVAKLIAKSVSNNQHRFSPGKLRRIRVEEKERVVYQYGLIDTIVHRAVAYLIEQSMLPVLSSQLYSYRKGIGWWKASSDFAAYIRAHRKSRPNPRDRGLYVLRWDIHAYTDSIPVGPKSGIWKMLHDILPPELPLSDMNLVEMVVQPLISGENDAPFCLVKGVLTGQPIAPVLYNLYLAKLDHQIARIPGGFYARYSDDILFAHNDAKVTEVAKYCIQDTLSKLELKANVKKSQNLYLTAAGRPSLVQMDYKGTSFVEFLGLRVSADSTVSLNRKKMRAVLRDIESRAVETARYMNDYDHERVGRSVCSVINSVLEPGKTPFEQRSAILLRLAVTDRAQLAQMDYWIARIVLKAVLGDTGVRAFRKVSYRKMRQDWRLISLVHARNKFRGR